MGHRGKGEGHFEMFRSTMVVSMLQKEPWNSSSAADNVQCCEQKLWTGV